MSETVELQSEADARSIVSGSGPAAKSTSTGSRRTRQPTLRDWLRVLVDRFTRGNAKFEMAIHQFASAISTVDDPAIVEAALLRMARQMAPASRIELVSGPTLAIDHGAGTELSDEGTGDQERPADHCTEPSGQVVLEVPLRCGASICGRLRIRSRSSGRSPLRSQTIQRLTTLCTMAASAMECLGRHSDWPRDDDQVRSDDAPGAASSRNTAQTIMYPRHPAIPIHDATFLNAVLPFALNQARRHREPLSLLCVAIDRLSGVRELFGLAEVDRLSRHVGEITSTQIRTSDIVVRLDDNRVVAVLPRAPRGGALHVAESICRAVAERSPADCCTPTLTVSIGVATFPSCANTVYSLFDAADEALARAQIHGRNQAVLAPPSPSPASSPGQAAAVGCPS